MGLTRSLQEPVALGRPQPGPRRMRVLMVAANLDTRFGGVSAVLGPLCAAIEKGQRFHVSIAAFAGSAENLQPLEQYAAVTRYPLRGLRGWFPGQPHSVCGISLARQIEDCDLVHIHGLWQEHCAQAAAIARRLGKPYVISAHGMLDPWALRAKKWKKSAYLRLVEHKNLVRASALHALTAAEAADYQRVTLHPRIEIVPNAVDPPPAVDPELFLSTYKELSGKTVVLFLSRLHPKKGLDLLSTAWSRVAPDYPDAHLVIAGPDEADLQRGLELEFTSRNVRESVTFTGMLSGAMKWSALAAARLFVLPSRSEGLSMAALEAMAAGKPVLLTEQCHLDDVVENECGYQIQPDAGELERALRQFFQSPERAREMGCNARRLAESRHCWEVVGNRVQALYERLVSVNAKHPSGQPA